MNPAIPTILVLENHGPWRDVIIPAQLEEFAAHVVLADTVATAREALRDASLAVIVLDLCLDEEGYTPPVQNHLREIHVAAPHTPIVVVTGKTVPAEDSFNLRNCGVVAYFDKKTIQWEKFHEAIEKILSRKGSGDEPKGPSGQAVEQAYNQYRWADTRMPKPKQDKDRRATDRKAFDWLQQRQRTLENQLDLTNAESQELEMLKIWVRFETWARYVRTARKRYSDNKNHSRQGRSHSGPIVEHDQV
jgi:DNA-binding response OmpR family regulator